MRRNESASDDQTDRRTVIRALGSSAAIGLGINTNPASAQSHDEDSEDGRPTVVVEAHNDCTDTREYGSLRWEYLDTGTGPQTVDIYVDSEHVGRIDRGRYQYRSAEPGEHVVEAAPAGSNGTSAIRVEGSPVEIPECPDVLGIDADLNCASSVPLRFWNPLDIDLYVQTVTYFESGFRRTEWDLLASSDWNWYFVPNEDGSVDRYEYTVYESRDGDAPTRPINGEPGTFVADRPCDELDLPGT